jgi:hypothetical protein
MYKQYLQSYLDCKFKETEMGFIGYLLEENEFCDTQNLFILPENRNKKEATNLINWVLVEAKEKNCKEVTCSIQYKNPMHNEALALALKMGFKLKDVSSEAILLNLE